MYIHRVIFLATALLVFSPACEVPAPEEHEGLVQLSFSPDKSERLVIRQIEETENSIYVALYGFDNDNIAEALIEAHRRGVTIQMVTEYDSESEGGWEKMLDERIPVTFVNKSGIMHNKYFIFDMERIITGSTNLTEGMKIHYNNMVVIRSSSMAADFKRDWDILASGTSDTKKDDYYATTVGNFDTDVEPGEYWPETVHQIGDLDINVYFTPYKDAFASYENDTGGIDYLYFNYDDNGFELANYRSALNIIIPLLQNATERIYVLTFAFTDRVIVHEMIEAAQNRDVDVRIWMDYMMYASQFNNSGRTYQALRDYLGPERARICRQADDGLLHHKVIIADDTLVLGSLNFSDSAVSSNDENFLVIKNAGSLIPAFIDEAMRIDEESRPIPDLN